MFLVFIMHFNHYDEWVACLVSNLEAYQRFWGYVAISEVGRCLSRKFKVKYGVKLCR